MVQFHDLDYKVEQTEHEQRMWEHYKKIEKENHDLKNQLANVNRENRKLRKTIDKLAYRLRKSNSGKQRYRNNGKGGK